MSEENIAVRLKFLIENLGITSSQFADTCNISRPTLSLLLSGRNKKISDIIISQIHRAYPSLSIMWLLFNEGDMWTGQPTDSSYAPSNEDSCHDKGEPTSLSLQGEQMQSEALSALENPSENLEISPSGQSNVSESKENGLNHTSNTHKIPINKEVTSYLKNAELLGEIAKIKEKTRKVVQVTIYYDDSTFQTFYPNR